MKIIIPILLILMMAGIGIFGIYDHIRRRNERNKFLIPKDNASYYDEYDRCRDYVQCRLNEVESECRNAKTVREGNEIYNDTLNKAIEELRPTIARGDRDELLTKIDKYYRI